MENFYCFIRRICFTVKIWGISMFGFGEKKKASGCIDATGKGISSIPVDFEPSRVRIHTLSKAIDLSSLSCNPGAKDEVDYTVERQGYGKCRIIIAWDVVGPKQINWSAHE
jgi:hypothetical protein